MPENTKRKIFHEKRTDAAMKLAGTAEDLLDTAHDRIERHALMDDGSTGGGRGIALVGIGNALCSIACTLTRIADMAEHPLVTVDPPGMVELLAQRITALEKVATVPDPESVEARIAAWRNAPLGEEKETPTELLCDAEEVLADLREKLIRAEGTGLKLEIAVAVVCIDCQRQYNHGPGRCRPGNGGCGVCLGGSGEMCACCDAELVLDESATSCSDDAAGVWCEAHCPARVRRESDIVARRVDCARGSTRCSEHCS